MLRLLFVLSFALGVVSCASTPEQDRGLEESVQIYWPMPPELPRYRYIMTFRNTNDFVQKSDSVRLREMVAGAGRPVYTLARPLVVASARGYIYLIDGKQPVVNVFDLTQKRYFKFGYRFEGRLSKPVGIAVDADGLVYVSDRSRNSIIVYDRLGLYRTHYSMSGIATQLAGIAVDDRSKHLYVVDRGGIDSDRHQVIKLTLSGEMVAKFGRRGDAQGEFNLPLDIAIDASGQLYVLDTGNFRVQVLTPDGEFVRAWGSAGNSLGQFGQPRSIAIDPSGNVYVSDTQFGNIQVFSAEGKLLMPLGRLSQEHLPGHYSLISGITVDGKGFLYALDQYQAKMDVFQGLTEPQGQKVLEEYLAQDSAAGESPAVQR